MNLRTLNYLVTLAEEKHFGKAAKLCFVSQPTLSAQIRKLEDELGVPLIERGPGKFLLTPTGEQTVVLAKSMLENGQRIADLAKQQQDPLSGPVSVGFIPTSGPYLMPHIVPELKRRYNKLRWHLAEHKTAQLLLKLEQGKLDVAIMALPLEQEWTANFEAKALFDEPFVVALPPEHELAKRSVLNIDDLSSTSLLLLQEGHCLRDQALSVCELDRHTPQEFTATSLETLRQMVAAGLGLTLLPKLAVVGAPASFQENTIAIRPLQAPAPYRTMGAVWRKSSTKSSAIEEICTTVATTIQQYL